MCCLLGGHAKIWPYLAGDLLGRAIALQVPADKPQQAAQKYDFAFDKVFAPAAGQVSHRVHACSITPIQLHTLVHLTESGSITHTHGSVPQSAQNFTDTTTCANNLLALVPDSMC